MTVVAEDDWIKAVMTRPERISLKRLDIIEVMNRRIHAPDIFWTDSLTIIIP
jgi:hypothetical protein